MKPTKSFIMRGQHLKRLIVLLLVALFCYHIAITLAEQRIGGGGNDDVNYPEQAASSSSSMLKSSPPTPLATASTGQQPARRLDIPQYATLRYNFRDLTPLRETIAEQNNGDNYRPTNGDQSELAKLEELLEALSMSLATVPPPQPPNEREQIHRSGRTYLLGDRQQQHQQQVAGFELSPAYIQSPVAEAPSSAAYNRYTTIQQQQARRQSPAEQSRQHQQAVAEGLAAISSGGSLLWPQSARSMSSERALSNDRANARRSPTNPRLTSDSAEVVIHTPLHSSRSVSDYEWKRVENSRWNNLRGMWGKRSVPPGAGADESSRGAPRSNDNDSGDGDGTYLRQQAEQHPKKRSQTLVAANGNFM